MSRLRRTLLLLCCVLPTLAVLAPGAHAAPTTNATFADERDVVFAARPNVQLKLDARFQPGRTGSPIVLLLHGGGWWYGTRRDLMDNAPVADSFVASGFVAIGIDYRLACGKNGAPRRRYGESYDRGHAMCGAYVPEQVADVVDAIRFVRANAARWGGDPTRIVLLGASAGGHLALLSAATAPPDARVSAVANWSGPSSTRFIIAQDPYRKPTIRPSFTNAIGCLWVASTTCKRRWSVASPMERISRRTQKFAVLTVSGELERQVPASAHRQFDTKLRRLGFTSRVISLPSICHGAGCRRHLVAHRGGYRSVEMTTVEFLAAHSRRSG